MRTLHLHCVRKRLLLKLFFVYEYMGQIPQDGNFGQNVGPFLDAHCQKQWASLEVKFSGKKGTEVENIARGTMDPGIECYNLS